MCGFFISNDTRVTKADEAIIEERLRFRGPDYSSGLMIHGDWKVYHSRLSIIDLNAASNQPCFDDAGGVLVFNGEILNYQELGQKYFNKTFQSDTKVLSELIVHGYLELDELDGFFAFVYVDAGGSLVHACRDKFGVKPLFVHESEFGTSFSSEPSVLKSLFDLQVNQGAIDEYYCARAPIFSGSYFNGVSSIEPGACLVKGQYFSSLEHLEQYRNTELEDLEAALRKGVDSRLVADAEVGLLLSRGVDSNLICNLAQFDKLYSIGFEGDKDISYLQSQSIENLTIHECTADEYRKSFEYLLQLRQEPMSVPNEVLLYKIADIAANDGVKVLLSGEGADEFFGGYDRVFSWASEIETFDLGEFLERYCYVPPEAGSSVYQKFENLFDELSQLRPFEKVRYFFIRYHMPVLFRRLDFALMAAGVEGREPIANAHVFSVAMNYCHQQLMANALGKIPLREVIAKFKGREFAYEKKVGFPVNLKAIFDNPESLSSYDLWFRENLKVLS